MGQYIYQLHLESEVLALAALYFVLEPGHFWPNNSLLEIQAQFRILQFRNPDPDRRVEALLQAIRAKSNESEQIIKQAQLQLTSAKEELELFKRESGSLKDEEKELQLNRRNSFDELKMKAQGELEIIKQTYDQHLALQQPVEYWKNKATDHDDIAGKYRKYFAGGAFIYILVMGGIIWALFFRTTVVENSDYSPYLDYLVLLAIATLLAWPLRVVMRLFLTHRHLSMDAKERSTMANTYLALLRSKESPITDNERQIFFASFFRPSNIIISKDDGSPDTFFSMIQKLVSGEKK